MTDKTEVTDIPDMTSMTTEPETYHPPTPPGVEPATDAEGIATARRSRALARRVLLTPPAAVDALLAESERARLAGLANLLLLVCIGAGVCLMPVALALGQPLVPLTGVVAITMFAAVLNRLGLTRPAMLLMLLACDAWIALAFAAAPAANADLLWALLVPTLLAAIFLPSRFCLSVAFAQCLLMVGLVFFAGVGGDPHALLSARVLAYLERPLLALLAEVLLASCWARGMARELARADRSEEIVALRQREAQRKRALEEGIREVLAVHAQLANGKLDVEVPALTDASLWRVAHSLTQLIAQLRRFAEADSLLVRTYERAEHLASLIRRERGGESVVWPGPEGTPLDPILVALSLAPQAEHTCGGESLVHAAAPASPAAVPPGTLGAPGQPTVPDALVTQRERAEQDLDTPTPSAKPRRPILSMPLKRGLVAPPRLVQTAIPETEATRRMDMGIAHRSVVPLDGLEPDITLALPMPLPPKSDTTATAAGV